MSKRAMTAKFPILALLTCLSCVAGAEAKIETIAGRGKPGFSGDGKLALGAELNNPYGLTKGPDGILYFCDMSNHRVRRVLANGLIETVAGTGQTNQPVGSSAVPFVSGSLIMHATNAPLNEPYEVRFDEMGNMYFVEMSNHLVRRVDTNGVISTVAGTGEKGFSGDGGPGKAAKLNQPHSIQLDSAGRLYICDIGNHRIRRVDLNTGIINTIAGTGGRGKTPDGAPFASAPLNGPRAIDFDQDGNMWLALREGNAIYKLDFRAGTIHHIAGTGERGLSGNGGPAKQAKLNGPKGIGVAPNGNVYFADTENHAIRMIDVRKGTVEAVAGTGEIGDGPDGEPSTCKLSRPHGVFVDGAGVLYIGDSENHRIRVIRGEQEIFEITRSDLEDKIRGGLLAEIIGNLNGLPHEMKYINDPGNVENYTPSLPEGARTDDDTDIEWVYINEMENRRQTLLPPQRIVDLWKHHLNSGIWCANEYARQLMDLGLEPPYTGAVALNPWSDFNISGQFVCESFGLISPAMPQTAAKTGLHYTRTAIEGEPAQSTQLFTSTIATAFRTEKIDDILDAGVAALDPHSVLQAVLSDVRQWHRENPTDWRVTRKLLRDNYSHEGGAMRDRNGYELNTGAVVGALLYGEGDFQKTITLSFNFGWDADCDAATAGAVVGVIKGYRWMQDQHWEIKDIYKNTARPGMPEDETITRFGDRLLNLAEMNILKAGGEKIDKAGEPAYRIPIQKPANVEPLRQRTSDDVAFRNEIQPLIDKGMDSKASTTEKARGAYLATAMDLAETMKESKPDSWRAAVTALQQQTNLVRVLRASPTPLAKELKLKAEAAGWLSK
jgi:streptogramin lyase